MSFTYPTEQTANSTVGISRAEIKKGLAAIGYEPKFVKNDYSTGPRVTVSIKKGGQVVIVGTNNIFMKNDYEEHRAAFEYMAVNVKGKFVSA
jgi:alpha-acetolactate decarboxylase